MGASVDWPDLSAMRGVALILLPLLGCDQAAAPLTPRAPQQTTFVGKQPDLSLRAVRQAVRAEANRVWGHDCGTVSIPDKAFIPIEVTGGGSPEYAVLFSHAICEGQHSASYFQGTGGTKVQIWSASQDAPRLLFEHQMHGFTPTRDGFISFQHGAFCNNAPGVSLCVVTYRWTGTEEGFEVQSRRLFDDTHPGKPPAMQYDWNYPLPG